MSMEWFEEVQTSGLEASSLLQQGDIIVGCNILIPGKECYLGTLSENDIEIDMSFSTIDVIILSQSCDLSNEKIDSIILCPIIPLRKLIEEDQNFKSSKYREQLRQGNVPSFHLLEKIRFGENLDEEFYVVNFKHIYSVPKDYLKALLGSREKEKRLRLKSPYVEHLSQSFARYFMRVGLPSSIDADEIKHLYKK